LAEYIKNTRQIKCILITIRTLLDKKEDPKIIDKYYVALSDALSRFSNCSEFACFINACDSFLDYVKKDIQLLKEITQRYFKKRLLNDIVPEEWVQAILDSSSSRKKGQSGEKKLLDILKNAGFNQVSSWSDFENRKKCVAKFSKEFSIKTAREKLCIEIATKKRDKKLDLIVKNEKKLLLCEAKHINTSGGEQDKQIAELIEIIGLKEKNENIMYVAFLDGTYSNVLLGCDIGGEKLRKQREEIKRNLGNHPSSFWVNTAGFNALIEDL